jgi:hypothetical protein
LQETEFQELVALAVFQVLVVYRELLALTAQMEPVAYLEFLAYLVLLLQLQVQLGRVEFRECRVLRELLALVGLVACLE